MVAMPSMSEAEIPASAIAFFVDSTVSSTSDMPVLRPICDIPMPDTIASRSALSSVILPPQASGSGSNNGMNTSPCCSKWSRTGMSIATGFDWAVHDVGRESQALLFIERDDGDEIRNRHFGIERVVVHRIREDTTFPADGCVNGRGEALRTLQTGGKIQRVQAAQKGMCSCPVAPLVQNSRLSSSRGGMMRAEAAVIDGRRICGLMRQPSRAAGRARAASSVAFIPPAFWRPRLRIEVSTSEASARRAPTVHLSLGRMANGIELKDPHRIAVGHLVDLVVRNATQRLSEQLW